MTGQAFITAQNHGYGIDSESLPPGWSPLFINANDGTNEVDFTLFQDNIGFLYFWFPCPFLLQTKYSQANKIPCGTLQSLQQHFTKIHSPASEMLTNETQNTVGLILVSLYQLCIFSRASCTTLSLFSRPSSTQRLKEVPPTQR